MRLNQKLLRSLASTCASVVFAILAGCATTSADRAVNMAGSVNEIGKQLEASRASVTNVLTTLNQLVTQPSGDMRAQYKDYLSAVNNLTKATEKVDRTIDSTFAGSPAYFADWNTQIAAINDPTLKQLSFDRKKQAVATLADLKRSIEKERAAFKPLAKDLNDVSLYLGNNLTAEGIAAIKPRLDVIKLEAVGAGSAIREVVQSLNSFSATIATSASAKK